MGHRIVAQVEPAGPGQGDERQVGAQDLAGDELGGHQRKEGGNDDVGAAGQLQDGRQGRQRGLRVAAILAPMPSRAKSPDPDA